VFSLLITAAGTWFASAFLQHGKKKFRGRKKLNNKRAERLKRDPDFYIFPCLLTTHYSSLPTFHHNHNNNHHHHPLWPFPHLPPPSESQCFLPASIGETWARPHQHTAPLPQPALIRVLKTRVWVCVAEQWFLKSKKTWVRVTKCIQRLTPKGESQQIRKSVRHCVHALQPQFLYSPSSRFPLILFIKFWTEHDNNTC